MPQDAFQERPLVSVILATFNEAGHVQKCMASLLEQELDGFDLEILAVDGLSDDGTHEFLEKTAATDPRVRVLVNEKRRAPFAFNLGLREAKGEYVCIFGSHSVYRRDYISVCLRELKQHAAVLCGGRVITQAAANTVGAHLVAAVLGHGFGSSTRSFRTQPEGHSLTVNFPVVWKEALVEIGGFQESLLRNQDNDIDQKLSAKGYRLFHTWKTSCIYHPKEKVKELLLYGYGNGFWNAISLQQNAASMSPRHFVPFAFVLGVLLAVLFGLLAALASPLHPAIGFVPLGAIVGLHLAAGSAAALQVGIREKFAAAIWLPFVFLAFHFSYGVGTFWAVLRRAKPPDSSKSSPAPARVRQNQKLEVQKYSEPLVKT